MSKMVYIIDEMGEQYEISDVDSMVSSLLDEDLIDLYKSTRYFNELKNRRKFPETFITVG